VASSRPSKDDLAALDALLGTRTAEGPLAAFEKPPSQPSEPRWEPRFSPGAAPRGRRPAPRRRVAPVLVVVAVLVVGGGVAAWLYLNPSRRAEATPTRKAAASPGAPVTPPVTGSSPAPVATTTAGALASPGSTVATPSPRTASPAPAVTPTPVRTPTPAASTPPPGPRATGGQGEASALLQRGDLGQAARAFAARLRAAKGTFSIQILVACSNETVVKAVQNVSSPELFILPVNFKGRDCYRICWGTFDSQGRAESAMGSVPSYFREGGATPKVVPSATLLP
jgi:hypothetical protein